MSALGLLHMVS